MARLLVFSFSMMLSVLTQDALAQRFLGDSINLTCNDPQAARRLASWPTHHPKYQGVLAVMGRDQLDSNPKLLDHPPLHFPDDILRAGYEGTVLISGLVDTNGTTQFIETLEVRLSQVYGSQGRFALDSFSLPTMAEAGFRREAINMFRLAKFRPGYRDAAAVPTLVCMPIDFRIRH